VGERQYEILRQQVLAGSDLTNCGGCCNCCSQEVVWVEQQGMAAWMAHAQDCLAQGAFSVAPPSLAMKEGKPSENDLVLVLADLVLGDRQEQHRDLRK
jgi:hypothetical protein